MPALLTHYLCGDLVQKSIDSNDIKDTVSEHRNLFNLGTQGPDVFFYHNIWPWSKGESLSKIGSRLHDEKVRDFFNNALEAIGKAPGRAREMLLSYIYGYVCHHSLDIYAHPYVFYKTGFVLDDSEDKKKYDAYHRRFEAELDVIMAQKILNKRADEVESYKLITIDREESRTIADMYSYIFKNIFDLNIPAEAIQKAARDMAAATKVLRDPLGIKKPLAAFAEKMMHQYHRISNMIYTSKIDESLDHLNMNSSPWYYPWDKSEALCSSFTDLFFDAVEEGKIMCKSISEYIQGNIDTERVLSILGNRSFSSGLDCDEDIVFKYCELIYK